MRSAIISNNCIQGLKRKKKATFSFFGFCVPWKALFTNIYDWSIVDLHYYISYKCTT